MSWLILKATERYNCMMFIKTQKMLTQRVTILNESIVSTYLKGGKIRGQKIRAQKFRGLKIIYISRDKNFAMDQ